ncbi:thiamine ABC transporter ATP-binding protein [Yoonia litorea]|uniref:Thiamine transport system ATP-binding protein n=1 Tax=Yoonia litorea TaxID=1123755 RepID=A0A1I6MW79_9RHOB|nr:ATP-binding cassette domain-containing protein [Yoonia litorea]SFS19887.1 thiamine transport system ATP-binding protein [Yoonia litorea]
MLTFDRVELRQGDFRLKAHLSVAAGSLSALIGPSGSGKSTLLAAIAGFIAPAQGRILWAGKDMTGKAPGQRSVAMLFQDNNLFPHLSAAQNVGLGLRPDLKLTQDDRERVSDALGQVGLAGLENRKPSALSGGQQSRVAIARVLVSQSDIVLLDEPFAALGPALKDEMLDLVADKLSAKGRTVIMVTHDPADARRIASQTIVVSDGIVHPPVETGPLLDNPPEALAAYLGGKKDKKGPLN